MDKEWWRVHFGDKAQRIEGYLDEEDRIFLVADYPDEDHNCDQMGCASWGPHLTAVYLNATKANALQDENARLKALLEHSKTQLEYDELQAENVKLKEHTDNCPLLKGSHDISKFYDMEEGE